MQTANLTGQVGQLAKMPLPTSKTAPAKDLKVGRQLKQKPRTHAHAGKELEIIPQIPFKKRHFKLYKKAENDFIQSVPLLFSHLENTEVVFHNHDFIEEIFDAYYRIHACLFLDWVKTFALIRRAERTELIEGAIQSTDEDFYSALRLFKHQSIKPKYKTPNHRQKIWEAITEHFPNEPFTSREIENITLIGYGAVNGVLQELKENGKLERLRKSKTNGRRQRFQLPQKSNSKNNEQDTTRKRI